MQWNNEKGFSLVEVIAAFVLISIILISFFTLFFKGRETTVESKKTVDATYTAQQEMESIYAEVQQKNKTGSASMENILSTLHYHQMKSCTNPPTIYTNDRKYKNEVVVVEVFKNEKIGTLRNVMVSVYDKRKVVDPCQPKVNPKAQMENIMRAGD
ncbi:type IV pilus modification PilV family protein [Kurthia gibsonii]|uniref:type IV pilus modification PilV family protein n=1 Tax=Kurthia gibsonii TaxID=33946 RepID=UPI0031B6CC90